MLAEHTRAGVLYERRDDGLLRCTACAHGCVIAHGSAGACGVRFAEHGELRVPWGYVARRYVRSVETNTIFHVLPGARALTFGMYGCDLRCPYCHNHKLSQALRDGRQDEIPTEIQPAALVDEAVAAGCKVVCAAYNEPMIAAEWARAVFTEAKARGLVTAVISDGNTTDEALRFLRPVLDVFRVDLKAADESAYRTLGGRLQPVLDGIERARQLGYWVEVVTLVVPGFNDTRQDLTRLSDLLHEIDRDLVWHLNGFYPRYKLQDRPRTSPAALVGAAGSALARGLRFVYASNLPEVRELAHTRCPECHQVLVRRADYATVESSLCEGACPHCAARIPGIWR
jgi:pyruvate formate lyase activating enzyme